MTRLLALLVLASTVLAQGTRADYARADALQKRAHANVTRAHVGARWLPDGNAFWYRNALGAGKREFVLVEIAAKKRAPLFDHEKLAAALRAAGRKDVTADRLPVAGLELEKKNLFFWFHGDGRVWKYDRKTLTPIDPVRTTRFRLPVARPHVRSRRNGGTSAVVFVNTLPRSVEILWIDMGGTLRTYGKLEAGKTRNQHTYAGHAWAIRDGGKITQRFVAAADPRIASIDGRRASARTRRPDARVSPNGRWRVRTLHHNVHVTRTDATKWTSLTSDGSAEDSFAGPVHWSPDSRHFVVMRTKPGDQRTIPIIESAPFSQLQPRLRTHRYTKPGDRLPHPRPWVFDVVKRKGVPVDDALFPNPWSLTRLRWSSDGRTFSFLYNQRGHQALRVIAVDAARAKVRAVVDETVETFVDYAGKSYLRWLGDDELVWMSERDGWNHLYLYDAKAGTVKNRITKGAWAVRRVDRVDAKARTVTFWAGGVNTGEDPYHLHYCRANLDGSGFVVLTKGDGTHTVDFSPDRSVFVDGWSRVDQPPVHVLRSAKDGSLICELERAEWTGGRLPERFVAKGRDGKTDIYGILHRPSNFDPKKKYPVVEAIYAGPHGAHVPKRFQPFHGAQGVAELGFIVVQIDGMGTSYRSKAFHDVCWKNLADAGFPDRIAWMKAAAKKYPQMDLARVGIYGGSAGGQNAMRGLLAYPDFYKVGIADCGCHDNRMDKIWWNELWMGWPIGPHYKEQSNVTQAHKLQGKLLLIVGEVDTNVDPASTMQVVDALVRADKDFDLVVLPGVGHGAMGTKYGRRRMRDFLVRHLHGVEPRR